MAEASKRVTELSADRLRALAAKLKKDRTAGEEPILPRASGTGPVPLSFSQERLWFLDQLGEGRSPYNVPAAVRLTGRLDVPALSRTWTELVRRHESLRTTFMAEDGRPLQRIAPAPDQVALPLVEVPGMPEAERLAAEEARRPFDLSRGPLLRLALLRLSEADHVLLLTMHHIVSDGWSMTILIREMTALYEAFRAGGPSPLPEPPIQYADFALWQRERLSGEKLQAEVAWWRGRLAGLEPLELPTDRPRPPVPSHRGGRLRRALPADVSERLRELGRRDGTTPFMVLLALWQTLLSRYTGQSDLAVGSPVANRNRSETEGLVGFFVNTLVLRADLAGDPGFRELLRRVRETTLAAYAHDELPFEKLVENLEVERSTDRNPLFQVLFTLQNQPWPEMRLGDVRLTPLDVETGVAKLDLSLTWTEQEGRFAATLEHSADLFEAETASRLLRHHATLLEAVLASPERRIGELEILSEAERRQLLVDQSGPVVPLPAGFLLHGLVEAQAVQNPEVPAVADDDLTLTYRELDERANRLARHLVKMGVGPEARVGLFTERSPEMIVGLLGTLKAGGAYIPLDPEYPAERLAAMIEDADPVVVLTQGRIADRLPAGAARVVCLEDASLAAGSGAPLNCPIPDEALAYLIFTSGSTGRPKGAMVFHRSIVNTLLWLQAEYPLAPGDRVLQKTPFSFDASVWEIWAPLVAGATLVMARPGEHRDPAAQIRTVEERGITIFQVVPALLPAFLDEGLGRCRGLRRIFIGGEALTADLQQRFFRAVSGVDLVNLYGPTETTVFITVWRCEPERADRPALLGPAIANARVFVLDRALGLSPVGVPGEISIGGVPVGRGYFGRPAETAERYVPDPFSAEPGARLYRTGDLGRRLPDGGLDYLGRIDHLVKIRGVRIELGEIEASLVRHPEVARAVVLARQSPAGPRLAAYVVAVPGAAADPAALRAFLRQSLPEAMVPLDWVSLPELPKTPNGKIDRKTLALLAEDVSTESEFVAPRTPTEELLAGIFAELLGRETVSVRDDFFALGGHSLLAIRVAARVSSVFGVSLPLKKLFEEPTVEALAAAIERAEGGGPRTAIQRLPRRQGEDFPLSFAQERLWFLDRMEPGTPTYNIPGRIELTGSLDAGALEASLREVVRRHEVLRTVYGMVDGSPRQKVLPTPEVRLPRIDLSALPEPEAREEAGRLDVEHARFRFHLAHGPLLHAVVLRLRADRHRFLAVFHHVAADGWSIGIFVREVAALYAAFSQGLPSPLPEPPLQYADFAVWQRRAVEETREVELAYWMKTLGGEIAPLELPIDRPRPAVQTSRGDRATLVVPPGLAARLRSFSRSQGATLFMTLLAAAKALLHRQSGQDDILVGSPVAGRRAVEVEGLIGCFLNTLALRTDLSGSPGFGDLLARVRETTLGAYSHQDVPFEAVLAQLPQERDLSRTPLFQVMFNLVNVPAGEISLPGLALGIVASAPPPSKFDMTFYAAEEAEGIRIELVYNADLFDAVRIEELLAQYALLLAQAAERPEVPVRSLSLVTDRARAVLPDPEAPLPPVWPGAVHELFAERARLHPKRPAVEDASGVWTYGALETASRRLAGWLAERGIGKGDRVAVYAHRSASLAVAVLGTLRAGAAFTILDPAYPAARLAEILRIAAPRALLRMEAAGVLPEALAAEGCPRLDLPAAYESLPDRPAPEVLTEPDDLAYVAFTSGSTGTPKAVAGPQRPLSHFLVWHRERFGLGESDRFSLLSGLAHDPLLRDLLTPLTTGAILCIPAPEVLATPGRLARWMREQGVTVAHLTPAMSEILTGAGGEELSALRYAFFGGDVLTRQSAGRLRRLAPRCAVVSYYGATETPQGMGHHVLAEDDRERVPLGRGIDGVQLLVLNRGGELAGVGELGEIAIRTPYLAAGYLNDEELTRERFVAGVYRTGDLGRYLPNGEVDFHGRADLQVKIRGYRIEPGEIEAALAGHPGVREALVVLRDDGEPSLTAYVVPETGCSMAEAELREHLRGKLPAPMMPGAFVLLEALPLTPNGKVDRRRLPRPERPATGGSAAPLGPTEELVAGIFADLLRVDRVGPEDDFFALGGHSLLAAQVVSRLREPFGVELPLRAVFESPTVAGLARRVDQAVRSGRAAGAPPLRPISRAAESPLSFAQQSLWLIDRAHGGSPFYNVPIAVEVRGPLDVPALAASLREIGRRHEMLRTVFTIRAGQPRQVVRPEMDLAPRVVDLSTLPEPLSRPEARRLADQEGRLPFDLERGPLLRTTLLRLREGEHVLLLTLHHVLSDAWSMGVLVREWIALYKAALHGEAAALPELPLQYADFAHWQRQVLRGDTLEGLLRYWRSHLGSSSLAARLPADRPAPEVRTHRGGREILPISRELHRELRRLGRGEGVTLFMLLLAAFKILLHRSTAQEDLVVGTAVGWRGHLETEGLIGCFANMIPLRTSLAANPSFRQLLRHVREVCLEGFAHQDLPFDRLIADLRLERDATGRPPVPVAFGVQNAGLGNPELPGLTLRPFEAGPELVRFDLTLWVFEGEDGMRASWTYSSDLFEASTVRRLHDRFATLLGSIVANPDARVQDLKIHSEEERAEQAAKQKRWEELKDRKLFDINRRSVRASAARVASGGEA